MRASRGILNAVESVGNSAGARRLETSGARPRIGVFDSGVGGLSVVSALQTQLPASDITYIADSAWAPYGPRAIDWIRARSDALVSHLVDDGCTIIVVACNTATAAAADSLRERWALPIIGMEPAVKPAATATRSGVVAVFATDGTLASRRFAGLLERYARGSRVIVEPCGDLVTFAERGEWDGEAVTAAIGDHVETICRQGADTLVLGCTHFPLLRTAIERAADGRLTIIDTAPAVARQVARRLDQTSADVSPIGRLRLHSSGDSTHLEAIARRLLDPSHIEQGHALSRTQPPDGGARPNG